VPTRVVHQFPTGRPIRRRPNRFSYFPRRQRCYAVAGQVLQENSERGRCHLHPATSRRDRLTFSFAQLLKL
jgi:hypothetical protein